MELLEIAKKPDEEGDMNRFDEQRIPMDKLVSYDKL